MRGIRLVWPRPFKLLWFVAWDRTSQGTHAGNTYMYLLVACVVYLSLSKPLTLRFQTSMTACSRACDFWYKHTYVCNLRGARANTGIYWFSKLSLIKLNFLNNFYRIMFVALFCLGNRESKHWSNNYFLETIIQGEKVAYQNLSRAAHHAMKFVFYHYVQP